MFTKQSNNNQTVVSKDQAQPVRSSSGIRSHIQSTSDESKNVKFQRLEAVRGFAALYVCLTHILLPKLGDSQFRHAFRFGQEAVIVFFILSGFVICWTTKANDWSSNSLRQYFLKRFTRIYSVWLPAVIAMFFIASVSTQQLEIEPIPRLLGNALMLQDFSVAKPAVICDPLYSNTPLWSLHYEWWFYVAFPLTLLLKNHTSRSHAVGLASLVGSITYVLLPNPLSRLCIYLGIWWIGVHAAATLRKNGLIYLKDLVTPLSYVLLSSMPLIFLCITTFQQHKEWTLGVHPFLEMRHLLSAVALVILAFAWRKAQWLGFSSTIGMCSLIAPISFSLYILHHNSIAHADYLKFIGNQYLEISLYGITTIVMCIAIEIYFYPFVRSQLTPKSIAK